MRVWGKIIFAREPMLLSAAFGGGFSAGGAKPRLLIFSVLGFFSLICGSNLVK
ncbi:MAG: hypothetical protein AB1465_05875 [Patescibacteria group bacterium]